jgi:hypothetical protein
MSHANTNLKYLKTLPKKVSLTGPGQVYISITLVVDSGLFHGDLATGTSRGDSSFILPGTFNGPKCSWQLAKIYVDLLTGNCGIRSIIIRTFKAGRSSLSHQISTVYNIYLRVRAASCGQL